MCGVKDEKSLCGIKSCQSAGEVPNIEVDEEETYQYESHNKRVMKIETLQRSTEMREKGTMVDLTVNKQHEYNNRI